MSTANLGDYILECARLIYWIFFKPFTLEQWLKDIHPDLRPRDNPYVKLQQFPNNQPLRRYAGQAFWITAITPQLVFLLVSLIVIAISQVSFNWFIGETFFIGWILGQIICRFGYVFFGQRFLYLSIGMFVLLLVVIQFLDRVVFNVVLNVVL